MTEELLEVLVNSTDCKVRSAVVKQGYGLNKLVNDPNSNVRAAVARQGYGLDKLINDKSIIVREAVAKQGYGLDKLINDEDWYVREAVAKQGYGLDKLINDKFIIVRRVAKKKMEEMKSMESKDIKIILDYNDFMRCIPGAIMPEVVYENAITKFYTGMVEAGASGIPIFMIFNGKYEFLGYGELNNNEIELSIDENSPEALLIGDINDYMVKIKASVEISYSLKNNIDIVNRVEFDTISLLAIKVPESNDITDENESEEE